jgi:beta-phosphoglucomutase-like phosphatase (HAD superfamily)
VAAKGVIVEFDFAAMNGAELLFETTKRFLEELDGIAFDDRIEARHMAGGNYQGAFAEYFPLVKTKKTAAKAAKDFADVFESVLNEAVPKSISGSFRNFVRTLSERGVKVVIATRADDETVRPAFAAMLGENVILQHEESSTYGSVKWDVWRRACAANAIHYRQCVAVTGSGYGVKSALYAGVASIGVVNSRTAYQDFSGADAVVRELNADTARTVLKMLRA